MHLGHHYHHQYHAFRLSGFFELNAFTTLHSIAGGISAIFVPLFLANAGYTFTAIFGYLFTWSLVWLATQYPAAWLLQKVGARLALGLSVVGSITQFLLLASVPMWHPPLILIALFSGVSTSLYWLSFRVAFMGVTAHRSPGKSIGFSNALWILVGGITPAIGGVVATLFGVPSLYVATVVFYLTSLVPLSQLKDISMPSSRKALSLKQIKSDLLANAAFNIDDVASGSVWTIFIFLFLKSYAEVGILASVTLLATILISLYMGWRQKDSRLHRYIRFGTGMTGLTNFLRVLVQAPLHISGVNFFQGAGKSLALTPYLTRYYLNAEKQGIPYITAMLAAGALACTVYFGILTLLTLLINVKIVALIGLLLGAPGILLAARIK